MQNRPNEYEIIKDLLTELRDEYAEILSPKVKKDYDKKDMTRYSNILQAEGALIRIKDSAQSVENFVNSLQRNFKREDNLEANTINVFVKEEEE
jgi:hypothetical protein|tara:strand:- start:2591 stop:2872 length:282 start_codon:yes stop_codon:yes gene_type:complete